MRKDVNDKKLMRKLFNNIRKIIKMSDCCRESKTFLKLFNIKSCTIFETNLYKADLLIKNAQSINILYKICLYANNHRSFKVFYFTTI